MKTRHTIFLVFSGVIFLTLSFSCKKYNYETTCAGYVIDFTTSEPIPGATVYLGRGISNFSGTDYQTIVTVKSDSHGKFNFKFMAEKTGNYFVLAKGAPWYFDNEIHEKIEIEKGKKASKRQQNIQLTMKPVGIIKFHITRSDLTYDYLFVDLDYNYQSTGIFSSTLDTNVVLSNIDGNKSLLINRHTVKYKIDTSNSWNEIYNQYDNINIFTKTKDTTFYNLNF